MIRASHTVTPLDEDVPHTITAVQGTSSEGEYPSLSEAFLEFETGKVKGKLDAHGGGFSADTVWLTDPAPLTETRSSQRNHAGSSACEGAPKTILHDILEHPVWSHPVWPWIGDVIGAISLFGALWLMLFIARIYG